MFKIFHTKGGVERFVKEVETEEEALKMVVEANQVEAGRIVYPGMRGQGREVTPTGWIWIYKKA